MPPSLISGVNSEVGESETPARLPKHPQSKAREVIRVGAWARGLSSCLPIFRCSPTPASSFVAPDLDEESTGHWTSPVPSLSVSSVHPGSRPCRNIWPAGDGSCRPQLSCTTSTT